MAPALICSTTIWVLLLVLASMAVHADPVDTNRPGFSFTPGIVAPGRWQLETGYSYTRLGADEDTQSLPQAELRFGVAERVELFVASLSWTNAAVKGDRSTGFEDAAVGAKFALGQPSGRTRMALLLQLGVPTGDRAFSSQQAEPSAAFVWTRAGAIPLAGTLKLSRSGGRYQLDNGLKLPFAVGEKAGVFVEWEANLPQEGASTHWLNGGFQWLLGDNVQLDLNGGAGLNARAGDFRLGAGFSYRR
jgi:hypothetical protein